MSKVFNSIDADFFEMMADIMVLNEATGCNCSGKCSKNRPSSDVEYPKLTDYVDRVIAQDNVTIIFWKDGTKSSVKCSSDDPYDYEKGLAMAIVEYVFGNRYYREMKKLMEAYPYRAKAPVKTKKKKAVKAPAKKTAAKASKTSTAKKTSNKSE